MTTAQIPNDFKPVFSDKRAFGFIATTMPDGSPQVTPVWIDLDGDTVVFNTATQRVKWANLRRDPRIAIAVMDPDNPYRYLQVRGHAELVLEGADAHIDRMAHKYLGSPTYGGREADRARGQERVVVRVTPTSVQTMG